MGPLVKKDGYKDKECYSPKEECSYKCDTRRDHTIPGPAILKCNCGNFGLTRLAFEDQTPIELKQPIASVTIDTACLHCPTIKVDFNGILSVITDDDEFTYTFNFTLYRVCKCSGHREALQSFVVPFIPADIYGDSTGLSFVYAQCDDQCKDCCTYTLELTSVSPEDSDLEISFSVNGTICALAVDSKCC